MLCYMLSVSVCSRKAVTGSQGCGRVWRLPTLGWLNFKSRAQLNFLEPEVEPAEGCWPAQASVSKAGSPGSGYLKELQITLFCPLRPQLHSGFLCIKNGWPPGLRRFLCSVHPLMCAPGTLYKRSLCFLFIA